MISSASTAITGSREISQQLDLFAAWHLFHLDDVNLGRQGDGLLRRRGLRRERGAGEDAHLASPISFEAKQSIALTLPQQIEDGGATKERMTRRDHE